MSLRKIVGRLLAVAGLSLAAAVQAASSVLIWPLNPSIAPQQRASALWLQNVGTRPVVLQARVLAWDQDETGDRYAQQAEVVATPPFTTLAPGAKQLIRLTAVRPAAPQRETAYRVLIDEIPSPEAAGGAASPGMQAGLRFQMRYSLPLFVYGEGWLHDRADASSGTSSLSSSSSSASSVSAAVSASASASAAASGTSPGAAQLSWRIVQRHGETSLQVSNRGPGHARLSQVSVLSGGRELPVAAGLLGYVLPGRSMQWALPPGLEISSGPASLRLRLDSRHAPVEIPMGAAQVAVSSD
ncbi:MAG: molecular chaperone [Burkholderiaceae bacterium]